MVKALISNIKITTRIRKEVTNIDGLAADIQTNGLINPITVMPLDGEDYRLLAGLRRLRAVESLGHDDIDINVVAPADAEAELWVEISENEQREPFTFSEKMDFARLLEEIERAKAKERMSQGGKGGIGTEGVPETAPLEKGKRREIVADKLGMGRTTYDCAKYIADNAPDEVIEELDQGQRSIGGTYNELRAKEKAAKTSPPAVAEDNLVNNDEEDDVSDSGLGSHNDVSHPSSSPTGLLTPAEEEAAQKIREFNAMTSDEKVVELQRQLKVERARAAHAESELARLKELRHNDNFHKDGIIKNLEQRLFDAEARVQELEAA